MGYRLNPYCSGRKNRILMLMILNSKASVLILIVVEERIGYIKDLDMEDFKKVLILIVVEERIGLPK